MNSSVIRVIDEFEVSIELNERKIKIVLKHLGSDQTLQASFLEDSMPVTLNNVINTPQQLFNVLLNIKKQDIKVGPGDQIIMRASLFTLEREFFIPLMRMKASCFEQQTQKSRVQQIKQSRFCGFTLKKQVRPSRDTRENERFQQTKKQKMLSELNFSFSEQNFRLTEENQSLMKYVEELEKRNEFLSHSNFELIQERENLEEVNKILMKQKQRLAQMFCENNDESEEKIEPKKEQCQNIEKQKCSLIEQSKSQLVQLNQQILTVMDDIVKKQMEIAELTKERAKLGQFKLELMKKSQELNHQIRQIKQKSKNLQATQQTPKRTMEVALEFVKIDQLQTQKREEKND